MGFLSTVLEKERNLAIFAIKISSGIFISKLQDMLLSILEVWNERKQSDLCLARPHIAKLR